MWYGVPAAGASGGRQRTNYIPQHPLETVDSHHPHPRFPSVSLLDPSGSQCCTDETLNGWTVDCTRSNHTYGGGVHLWRTFLSVCLLTHLLVLEDVVVVGLMKKGEEVGER